MDNNKIKRDYALDFIKFIAIVLVVCYHSYYLEKEGRLHSILYSLFSMGVPLFFFVNGSLMLQHSYNIRRHGIKIGKIILLTFVWSCIVLSIIKFTINNHEDLSFIEYAKILWYLKTGYVINQYWFLLSLVMIYIFYPLIKQTFDKDKTTVYVFCLIVFILTFGNKSIYLIHQLLSAETNTASILIVRNYIPWYNIFYNMHNSYSLVYFITGGIVYYHIKNNTKPSFYNCRPLFYILFMTSWLLAVILSNFLMHKINWDPCYYGYDTIPTFIMTCCLCILVLPKVSHLPYFVKIISQNTLGIYLTHGIIIYLSKTLFAQQDIANNILGNLIYSILILTTSLFLVLLVKRIPYLTFLIKL